MVIHRGWLLTQQQPAVSPTRRGNARVADVAQALSLPSRHSCRLLRRHSCRRKPPSNYLPSRKTNRKQPFFAFPVGGGCKVQSTGARGASINIRAQSASDGPSEPGNTANHKQGEAPWKANCETKQSNQLNQTVRTGTPAGPSPQSGEARSFNIRIAAKPRSGRRRTSHPIELRTSIPAPRGQNIPNKTR